MPFFLANLRIVGIMLQHNRTRYRTEIRHRTSPAGGRRRIAEVENSKTSPGAVLVLPGGKPISTAPSKAWQLANLRMALLTSALRHRLPAVTVTRVRYRVRGWNAPQLDPVRDAEAALERLLERFAPERVVVVGHSMGGRVAAHLAGRRDVGGVVALAPWWPASDADLIPVATRLLTVHGTADTWTDPASSRQQCLRAANRGVVAHWVGLPGAGHYMLRRWRLWHTLTADFAAEVLDGLPRH
jgi:pimeloyl-ACP methyl ester carboxylesterase